MIPFDRLWEQYNRIIKDDGIICLFGCQPFTSIMIASNLDMFRYSWVWIKNRATGHMLSKVKPMKKHEDICIFSKSTMDNRGKANNIIRYYPQGLIDISNQNKYRVRNDNFDDTIYGDRDSTKETKIEYTNYPTDIIQFDIEMNEDRYHPTQKPQQLLEYLIKTYTIEGDLVMDNCMGGGSTGVACKRLNRNFIGIEKDTNYFYIAQERIDNANVIKNDLW